LARFLPGAKIIHLVRNPEGILASNYHRIKKGSGFKFLRRRYKAKKLTFFFLGLSSISWVIGNVSAELVRTAAPKRVIRIRYEDLCSNPRKELQRLSRFIGCDLQTVIEAVEKKQPMEAGHNIGGNHMRMAGSFVFNPSAGQKRKLPLVYRLMVQTITWPLKIWYGYYSRSFGSKS